MVPTIHGAVLQMNPTAGATGGSVTLSGASFAANPAANIVYFGAARASVTSATENSLSVIVPTGATYSPVSVTVGGVSTFSAIPFDVTFRSSRIIDSTSFAPKVDFPAGKEATSVALGDLDGDGKVDLALSIESKIAVYRNTHVSGAFVNSSLAPPVLFDHRGGVISSTYAIDLDGDGKLDLACAKEGGYSIAIYKNTSVPGVIGPNSFVHQGDYSAPFLQRAAVGDLDGDGKVDMVAAGGDADIVHVFRNTSSSGQISFALAQLLPAGSYATSAAVADIDGDGKRDLAVTVNSGLVFLFRNTSSPGSIVLTQVASLPTDSPSYTNGFADIDGDGKLDLIVNSRSEGAIAVFHNRSTFGNFSFAPKTSFPAGEFAIGFAVGDLDGDGKPDVAVANWNQETVSVLKNTAAMGVINSSSFAPRVQFTTVFTPYAVATGDLNGDSKPELIVPSSNAVAFSVLQNVIATPPNKPPTLTVVNTLPGGTEDTDFPITHAMLLAAADASDVDGDVLSFRIESVSSGTLTKAGVPVVLGNTRLGPGESVVWNGALHANGTLEAFQIKAWDGALPSSSPVAVSVAVTAVNDLPTLTTVNSLPGGTEDIDFLITHAMLLAAADEADVEGDSLSFRIERVSSGTLTKAGVPVVPGNTRLGPGESVVWRGALHANGTLEAFQVKAWDGALPSSSPVGVSVAVSAVNDVPSFGKGPDQSVLEDAGAQSVPNWASAISTGPADEASQTKAFIVTLVNTTNPDLFASSPEVTPEGTLTYAAKANASGSATFDIVLKDNGGTADGGRDTSDPQRFSITVNPANDVPSFAKGADQSVFEDSGAQSVPNWATAIRTGPADEASQTKTFLVTLVSTTNPDLFAAGPEVTPEGTLTYAAKANASGSATFDIVLKDDGGTANGGRDTSDSQRFSLTINPVNDVPSFAKGLDQSVLEDAGAQSIPNWATAIRTGPADEASQTKTFLVTLVSITNPDLFASGPEVTPEGTLTYAAKANASGSASFDVVLRDNGGTANGGRDASDPQRLSLTVNPVNDVPSFGKGPDQSVLEDAGAQSVPNWASAISTGPADEASQTKTFILTQVNTTNPDLFASGPEVTPEGTLTYAAGANASGSATFEVVLKDNGGTANGGRDTSDSQRFSITVNLVNDVPSFAKGRDQSVLEDAGAQSVPNWASAISTGPADEASQTKTFFVTLVSTTNPDLFASGPEVTPEGTLTYAAKANASGSASFDVVLKDNGGTADGGRDTSDSQRFSITVNPVNDTPRFTKGADQRILENALAQTVPNWATDIKAGPLDENAQALAFTVRMVNTDNPSLFTVVPAVSSDGTLTYAPAPNQSGTATLEVLLNDNGGTGNGGDDTSDSLQFTVTVITASQALADLVGELRNLLAQPGLTTASRQAIQNAIDQLIGQNGGAANNGALDQLEIGNLEAALVKIRKTIGDLETAEAADPSLDLSEYKTLLALAAKSVVVGAIAKAEGSAASANDRQKVAQARALVDQGQSLIEQGNYIGAANKFLDALSSLKSMAKKASLIARNSAFKLEFSKRNPASSGEVVFRLTVHGRAGAVIAIERSQDMKSWEVFEHVELGADGSAELEVANPGSRGVEFYQIREVWETGLAVE